MIEIRQRLLAVAAKLGLPPDQREDVAQEALARLLAVRRSARTLKNETAFVVRTAVHLAIDRIRARRRHAALLQKAPDRPGESDACGADRPEEVAQLYAALRQLPERQAAVIALRKLLELEYSEIALLMQTSEENCRSLCRHALIRLRECLRPSTHSAPDQRVARGAAS